MPRSTGTERVAAEQIFAHRSDEEESASRPSSNEASLRRAATLGHDVFDADERQLNKKMLESAVAQRAVVAEPEFRLSEASQVLEDAVAEAQRTLMASTKSPRNSGSNEADLRRLATLSHGFGETSSDSGESATEEHAVDVSSLKTPVSQRLALHLFVDAI